MSHVCVKSEASKGWMERWLAETPPSHPVRRLFHEVGRPIVWGLKNALSLTVWAAILGGTYWYIFCADAVQIDKLINVFFGD